MNSAWGTELCCCLIIVKLFVLVCQSTVVLLKDCKNWAIPDPSSLGGMCKEKHWVGLEVFCFLLDCISEQNARCCAIFSTQLTYIADAFFGLPLFIYTNLAGLERDVGSAALPKLLCPPRVLTGSVIQTGWCLRGIILGCLPPSALLVLILLIPGGIEPLPHSVHLQIPAHSFLLSLARRCSQKGAWKQGRGIEMWVPVKSPESKYRQSVFHVMYLILKLLWLPPASPFHLSIENTLTLTGAEEKSLDVAGY